MVGRFRSILFVSAFQGSLAVTITVIDGKKNAIVSWALNFRVRMLLKDATELLRYLVYKISVLFFHCLSPKLFFRY